MAKVVMPLLSGEARGKVGDALVFFPLPHCEYNVVRRWLKSGNPQSASQGNARLRLQAAGYGNRFIVTTATLATQIKAKTPYGQTWAAYFLKTILGPNFANIDASLVAWDSAGNQAHWNTYSAALGMEDQDIGYASIDAITAGEVLFCQARAAFDLGLGIAVQDAQDMTEQQISDFKDAFTT
jgi:hypothetical protein